MPYPHFAQKPGIYLFSYRRTSFLRHRSLRPRGSATLPAPLSLLKDKTDLRSVTGSESDAEAQVVVAAARHEPAAVRGAAAEGAVAPAPTANDTKLIWRWECRVSNRTVRIIATAIAAPFKHVADHVVESPVVRLLALNFTRSGISSRILLFWPLVRIRSIPPATGKTNA